MENRWICGVGRVPLDLRILVNWSIIWKMMSNVKLFVLTRSIVETGFKYKLEEKL